MGKVSWWGRGISQWSGPYVEGAKSSSEVARMGVREGVRSLESQDRWQGCGLGEAKTLVYCNEFLNRADSFSTSCTWNMATGRDPQ